MDFDIEFIKEAKLDVSEGFNWYDTKVSGLGSKFLESISNSISFLEKNSYQYQLQYGKIRKVMLTKFPYQIIYFINKRKIIVLGVIHSSRDPTIWENRI
ncbi:MAG: type II toxin-antitoxin system RelE/ParE family toxin [Cyclobacteriaceae bacterium]|nr:type II toxin-antitoxin system RelE/ParE family toxin [Cyclobacteriaceae bacterium]